MPSTAMKSTSSTSVKPPCADLVVDIARARFDIERAIDIPHAGARDGDCERRAEAGDAGAVEGERSRRSETHARRGIEHEWRGSRGIGHRRRAARVVAHAYAVGRDDDVKRAF